MPVKKSAKKIKAGQNKKRNYLGQDDLQKILDQNISQNALTVIEKRYLLKNENLEPTETPLEMFIRVADHIAKAEKLFGKSDADVKEARERFLKRMLKFEFLPNSPTFTGAGTKLGQLSACFVLPIEDDMKSILKTQMDMGMIHKSGGGTGFSFSRLRPENDVVGSTGGVSCGPIGFLQMYNDTTEQIKQGGTRRGANMGILRIDHPDILKFIDYKEKEGTLSNFNISVAVTDKFMKSLEKDEEYELINPRNNEVTQKLKAKEVWDKIIVAAHRNGEPGVVFIDVINKYNVTPEIFEIEGTNPCGEQPLGPYESCNLTSINLDKVVIDKNKKSEIDWEKLDQITRDAIWFMDNVVEVNKYPIPEIEKETKFGNRKLGLGVMGFADMLLHLGISYNSQKAFDLAEKIMARIKRTSHNFSEKLAHRRGVFPNWKGSLWDKKRKKMRNATTTTIAPTGTISMMASCSSGIEPIFALSYTKTVIDGTPFPEVNKYFKKVAKERGFYSKELMDKISKDRSIADFPEIPEDVKKIFVTAADISPEEHVKMQAIFQKQTDNAISKTINFKNDATKEDVDKAYRLAYKLGCKGITIYRDGSREEQILTTTKTSKKKISETQSAEKILPRERPPVVSGKTYKIKTGYGKMYITVNDDEKGDPFEVFTSIGKAGGFFQGKAEAISRLISLALRSGIDVNEIIDQLKGIRGPTPIWGENGMVLSMADGIAQILQRHIDSKRGQMQLEIANGNSHNSNNPGNSKNLTLADLGDAPACPECGSILVFAEGCVKCNSCGYSKCS